MGKTAKSVKTRGKIRTENPYSGRRAVPLSSWLENRKPLEEHGGWRLGKLPPGHSLRWLHSIVIFVRTEGPTSQTIVDKAIGVLRVARDFPQGEEAVLVEAGSLVVRCFSRDGLDGLIFLDLFYVCSAVATNGKV